VGGDFDSVDIRFLDAGEVADGLRHFGRADVFAFPAVGVAEPIHEEPAAVGETAQRVAGSVV